MLCNTQMHPFRAYVHNLCLVSNDKLADPRTGQFRRLSLHRRLMVCNVITDTSAAMCQPAYISMRHYSHDIQYIPGLHLQKVKPQPRLLPPRSHERKTSDSSESRLPYYTSRCSSSISEIMV
ncbi:hypothetical protein DSO57_1012941 [Entomophthora muscae]|uniref:Uncharacterized protein n=1 Tax=Entomophthora muscae TaxID=34485 RepID=A0ACC2SV80_9FUNG|nr:hypothetical protein DSO57_1012941 [Entomophthora muscae]